MKTHNGGFNVSRLAMLLQALFLTTSHAQNLTFHQGCGNEDLVCHVFKNTVTYKLSDQRSLDELESYECFRGDMSYDLSLPQAFIDSHPDLDQGTTRISIPGGCINGTAVTYPPNATITVLPEQRRLRSKATEGNVTVLVVRVTKMGRRAYPPNFQIGHYVFGDVAGSFENQMSDCSIGKFNIQKAQGPGIVDGIFEINLDFDIEDMRSRDVERKHVVPKLAAIGGEGAFDHVMYCLPYGTRDRSNNKRWAAYALLNHGRSVYNDRECGVLSTMMHEVGHNLGLHHANQGWSSYGDLTGFMGASSTWKLGPRSCYNAQKNWQLGWYDDASIDLSRSIRGNPWGGRLMAFVDYNKTAEDDAVVIRVGTLYVQYNRQRDFNDGTREFRNRVVIVSAPNTRHPQSNLEAGIAKGISGAPSMFAYPNFEGTGHDLVFEVCDQVDGPPDYVHLSIHRDDGVQSSMCSVPLPVITDAPTISPTMSVQPSSSPTQAPSFEPTISPEPSQIPTESPTTEPSSSPVEPPTSSPSISPSASPTLDCTGMDQLGLVPVNKHLGGRTCSWIAANKWWKKFLCREGYEAFEQCQETCDSCNAQDPEPSGDTCEDSRGMFYVNKHLGNMRCFWLGQFLERSPRWKDEICAPDQAAYDFCPETCGKCSDTCEDQTGVNFYVNRRQGQRDCAWLAKRPMWQAILCYEGHNAYKYCGESCDSCP